MAAGGGMIRVCLTGAESTGKSTAAPRLAARFGGVVVPEYGRTWAEANGASFTRADLRAIASGHIAGRLSAESGHPALVIEDTDIVTTAVWSELLFGSPDPTLQAIRATADLYLLYDADTPWIDDGTRRFGEPVKRAAFQHALCREFARRGIVPVTVGGDWDVRFEAAAAAIGPLLRPH